MKKTTVRNLIIVGISFLGLGGLCHLAKERKCKTIEVKKRKEENISTNQEPTNYITVYQTSGKTKEDSRNSLYHNIEEVEIEEIDSPTDNKRKYHILKYFSRKN